MHSNDVAYGLIILFAVFLIVYRGVFALPLPWDRFRAQKRA